MAADKNPSVKDTQKKNAATSKALGATSKNPLLVKPKATTSTPAPKPSAVANYFQGTNLTGVANALKNAPKPTTPSWAQNLTNSLKTNPKSFANYLGMGSAAGAAGTAKSLAPGTAVSQGVPFYLQKPAGTTSQQQKSGGTGVGGTKYMTPDQLYVDPTPAYQPVLDYLAQQEQAAKNRYAVNNANIKNIFGALTGLTAADSARITKQFTDSLTASKADLAARTAEARAGAAAGTEQAAATGAERGGGPEMAVNPVQVAAEEGIARSNEYATTWQNLQQANQQQAMADISARGAGYGQQEVGAIQQLAQNLEDKLLAIGGNTAQVQSDIAQAKFGQEKDIQEVKFQLSEQAKQAAAQAAAAAAQKPSYGKDIFGLRSRMADAGVDFETIAGEVAAATEAAYIKLNTVNGVPRTSGAPVTPNAAAIKAEWNKQFGTSKTAPYAQSYIDLQS